MAEALGVAGSIVGIVSLGIQVSQGLLKYYNSYKNQDAAIAELCRSLENLLKTIERIQNLDDVAKGRKYPKSTRDSVQKNIKHVKDLLDELDQQLKNVQGAKAPDVGEPTTAPQRPGVQDGNGSDTGLRALIKRHWQKTREKTSKATQRVRYPFKEETLKDIQGKVSEARDNLGLALQVLQQEGISVIRDKVENEETERVCRWLSSKNFWLQQDELCKRRQDGTSRWLLKHRHFLDWVEGKKEQLWCLGNPGVGKTMLMSAVVEYLEGQLQAQKAALIFVYCDHKENLSQRLEYFLGAMTQVAVRQMIDIPEDVSKLYLEHRKKGTNAGDKEYMNLLQSLTKDLSTVYVVIDALDECVDKNGWPIWAELIRTLKNSIPNLRLLYSSRQIKDIAGVLAESTCIEVEARDDDIRSYVRAQVRSRHFLADFCMRDAELQEKIVEAVLSGSQRIFLAAQFHIEFLATKRSPEAVKNALNELPPTLDDHYDKAMERIERQSNKAFALQVLEWVALAVRPLQLREVQHAVADIKLNPDGRLVRDDDSTQQNIIINACAGLVQINNRDNIISLVHKTTQEYFDRNSTKLFPLAERTIAATCLKYLSLDIFSEGPCSTYEDLEFRLKEHALLTYAAEHIGHHFHEENSQTWVDLAARFSQDENKLANATQCLFQRRGWRAFPKRFSALHYAAYCGSAGFAKLVLRSVSDDVDSLDSYGRTPLSWAAKNGHEAVVKLLLDTGKVDIDSKDTVFGQTPLSLAAEYGHEAVVKLLLDTGKVDVDCKDTVLHRTPLSWAAGDGHEAVVKLLLDTGKVDIDSKDTEFGRTPLLWAAEYGQEAVVKLLLDTGKVDVDWKDTGFGQTPLSWAAESGHEAVVKLLLDTGKVDVDSKDTESGRTPLSWAAGDGHEAVVRLLLDTGKVDVDSKDTEFGRTPLSWAAGDGHEAVVKLLLGTGKVDVDSKDTEFGRTPLLWAAENGREAVVRLLQSSISSFRT